MNRRIRSLALAIIALMGIAGGMFVAGSAGASTTRSKASAYLASPVEVHGTAVPAGCAAVRKANPTMVGRSLVIGTDPEGPPFESINAKGVLIGFDIDLAADIMSCL